MPRVRRSFDADFKARLVLELLTGSVSQAELCRKHDLKPQLIAHWKAIFLDRLPLLFQDGEADHDQDQAPGQSHLNPKEFQQHRFQEGVVPAGDQASSTKAFFGIRLSDDAHDDPT